MFPDPTLPVVAALVAPQAVGPPPIVLDASANAWLHAAQSDRADVLVLGDSVVWFDSHGWDEGFNYAISERFGLAGTGLLHESNAGSGFSLTTQFGWLTDINDAPPSVRDFAVQNHAYTTGLGSQRRIGIEFEAGSPLDDRPMSLIAWGGSATGSDAVFGAIRRGDAPFTVYHQTDEMILTAPAAVPASVTFDLPAGPAEPIPLMESYVDGSDDASYVYLRAIEPGAVGGTVTSIGLGGQSVRAFYETVWIGGSWTQSGRAAFLDAIVQGGSGKLMIPIFEGFNDRNESHPSLTQGLLPGDSSAAFVDNVDTLIRKIREDWQLTGRPDEDLSFVVFGMYEIVFAPNTELNAYRYALRQYADQSPGVTYIDLLPLGIPFTQARPAGLLSDGTHLSKEGSRFFGERIFDIMNWAACPGDLADSFGVPGPDGVVDFGDFLAMLGAFGPCDFGGVGCLGDISDELGRPFPDGQVAFGDLLALISAVGPCD